MNYMVDNNGFIKSKGICNNAKKKSGWSNYKSSVDLGDLYHSGLPKYKLINGAHTITSAVDFERESYQFSAAEQSEIRSRNRRHAYQREVDHLVLEHLRESNAQSFSQEIIDAISKVKRENPL